MYLNSAVCKSLINTEVAIVFSCNSLHSVWLSCPQNCCVFKTHSVCWPFAQRGSFPISHPATWSKLRHTSIFTQWAAPPAAVWAQSPLRTSVSVHRLCSGVVNDTSQLPADSSQPVSPERYDFLSFSLTLTVWQKACLSGVPLSRLLHVSVVYLPYPNCISWCWSADFWTVCQMTHWVCCVWFKKSCCHVGTIVFYMNTKPLFTNLQASRPCSLGWDLTYVNRQFKKVANIKFFTPGEKN